MFLDCKACRRGNVKIIIINIMKKHVNTAKVICCKGLSLPIETLKA